MEFTRMADDTHMPYSNNTRATHKHSLSSCKNLCMCMAGCMAVEYVQTGRCNKLTCGTSNSVVNETLRGPKFVMYALGKRIKLSTQMCTTPVQLQSYRLCVLDGWSVIIYLYYN